MFRVLIEDGPSIVLSDEPIVAIQGPSRGREKENAATHGFHQDAIVNRTNRSQSVYRLQWAGRVAQSKFTFGLAWNRILRMRVRPCPPIEQVERDATPFQIEGTGLLAINGNMHHQCI